MKNAKNVIVATMMAMTIATYANATTVNKTSVHILASVEEKVKVISTPMNSKFALIRRASNDQGYIELKFLQPSSCP